MGQMMANPQRIILLRGLSREHRHWGRFPALLQRAYPDSNIVCADLPGNGDRNLEKSPLSIAQTMRALRQELKPLLNKGPLHLIALSLGGMVAMEWMNQYPDEIASAILMSSSFKGVSPFHQRLRPANYVLLIKTIFHPDIYQREKNILKMTSQLHRDEQVLLQQWLSYAQQSPVSRMNVLRQLVAASRYRLPQQKPQLPVLLLSAQRDELVSPQCSEDLSRHWNLPLQTHPGAGHDLSLDDEQWVLKQVCKWFDGL